MKKHDIYVDHYVPSSLLLDDAGVEMRREYTRMAMRKFGKQVAGFSRRAAREISELPLRLLGRGAR